MLFMLIGRFRRSAGPSGRSLPALPQDKAGASPSGLKYLGSWVEVGLSRCFQIVDCDNVAALQRWAVGWRHCVELEVVPIVPAADAVTALQPLLD